LNKFDEMNLRTLVSTMFSTVHRCFSSNAQSLPGFNYILLSQPQEHVVHVTLNRPEKMNALNELFWREIGECFQYLSTYGKCRAIVLSANGRTFCSGIDFNDLAKFASIAYNADEDVARRAFKLRSLIQKFQNSFTSLEKCSKPIIAAINGNCIGAGVDLICAADIRYCSDDASFQIREVDIGMAADVGTLQRLPKIVGNHSLMRELAFTARSMLAEEALEFGLVNRKFSSHSELVDASLQIAAKIAAKSPVAVQGTKLELNYARDHPVDDSLHSVAMWNMCMLQSEDVMKAASVTINREKNEAVTFDTL
ncbi:Delta(3,5)-Delta(2,4)-dienoyl-CoA isomerase, mitochondrial, partial [Trichinella nativa]